MEYGLIGVQLSYSFSKLIHETCGHYPYELISLPTEAQARDFLQRKNFRAINVTIPYKKLVMEYCDVIDEHALAIGAVNTVVNRDGKLYGFNTDYAGFAWMCKRHNIDFTGKTVLILGTGGTSNTVRAVVRDSGARAIYRASRNPDAPDIRYADAPQIGADIIINTTPVGTYPNVGAAAINLHDFSGVEAVVDVVYNPFCTELLLQARECGIPSDKAVCGVEMLVAQAVFAMEHFFDKPLPTRDAEIIKATAQLRTERANIALIGMPGCGKTSLGKKIAAGTGKTFVDVDAEIERTAGMAIPDIFASQGEAAFRALERETIARLSIEHSTVISCGGGAVLNAANMRALRQNGPILFIDRPLEQLAIGGNRPLSSSKEALQTMGEIRRPLYEQAADLTLLNNTSFSHAVDTALSQIRTYFINA